MYPASRVAVPRVAASLHAAARHSRPVPRVRKSTNKFPKSGLDLRWFIWLVQKSPAMRYVGLQYAPSAGRHDQSHRRPAALKASERSRPLFAANVCPKSGFLEIKTYPNGTLTSHIVIDPRPSETESGLQALAHFIAYFRVSTDRQGKSGLGLAVQREAVMSYLDGGRWALVDEFTEVESGKRNDRPELEKALSACKRQKAKLRPCL
jgi:Resolvase, N terminal domain